MNLFDTILLNIILISFPLLLYMLYVLTDKNINKEKKDAFFKLTLISSFFLLINYGIFLDNIIIALFSSAIIFLACLHSHFKIASVLGLVNIILNINMVWFLVLSYVLIGILVYIRIKNRISDLKFVNIFIIIYIIIFVMCGIYYKENLLQWLFLGIMFAVNIHFIYLFFTSGTNTLKSHMEFKELQRAKQLQFSLFKITHEIKNPIAVCKAYLDMFDIENNEHSRNYVPIIKGEIERLLILLQDFLLVNKENMKYEIMDVNILLEDVVDKVSELMINNNIEFKTDIYDDELLINGDYNRLNQVLVNIIKNSLEANPDEIKIKTHLTNQDIELYIVDNGTGISNDILEKIYEPFYTTKATGTGLGVSLSNEIIEAHNGTLKYFSKPNQGTTVKITIPIHQF